MDGYLIVWDSDEKTSIQYIILIRFSSSENSAIALTLEWLKWN